MHTRAAALVVSNRRIKEAERQTLQQRVRLAVAIVAAFGTARVFGVVRINLITGGLQSGIPAAAEQRAAEEQDSP